MLRSPTVDLANSDLGQYCNAFLAYCILSRMRLQKYELFPNWQNKNAAAGFPAAAMDIYIVSSSIVRPQSVGGREKIASIHKMAILQFGKFMYLCIWKQSHGK